MFAYSTHQSQNYAHAYKHNMFTLHKMLHKSSRAQREKMWRPEAENREDWVKPQGLQENLSLSE